MFTITKMFIMVFLHARYALCMCTRVRPVIIAPIVKSINCLTCTLFSTFVTSKEINQTFFHAVESMINFASFSSIPYSQTLRIKQIRTTSEGFQHHCKELKQRFLELGCNSAIGQAH